MRLCINKVVIISLFEVLAFNCGIIGLNQERGFKIGFVK
jgi:hypothetical protein